MLKWWKPFVKNIGFKQMKVRGTQVFTNAKEIKLRGLWVGNVIGLPMVQLEFYTLDLLNAFMQPRQYFRNYYLVSPVPEIENLKAFQ